MFDFDSNGNCTPGIHETTLEEIEKNLVNRFTKSATRRRNIDSLKKVIKSEFFVKYNKYIDNIWVDGSFCSMKENPNDIDGIVFAKFETLEEFGEVFQKMQIDFEIYRKTFRSNYCDLYLMVSKKTMDDLNFTNYKNLSEIYNNYQYWKGQFGFDRNDCPKGIYSFTYLGGEVYE